MIASVEDGEVRTTGCGCCATNLYLESDREEILKQLKRNVEVVKDTCKALNIDFLEFVCS